MADLLFELLCEELPPRALPGAARAMEAALAAALASAGLAPASTAALWTPRRIALLAAGLPDRTADRAERVKGPRVAAAFDASGAPTRAAEGFARKNGVEPAALERDGEFVWATVRTPGRAAADVVAEVLPGIPSKAGWKKTMRWGAAQTFARPVRGVVALLGADVVPCEVAGLPAGRETRGHPFLAPERIALASADRGVYVATLRAASVLVDPDERRRAVVAAARGATAEADLADEGLVGEVTNLVERPSALLGNFDARFLDLPPRLLVTVMAHHQRFFPVRGPDGALKAHFVAILDRDETSVEPSRRGFERVLVPRLHDAAFFMAEDRKRPLADRLERLATVTYHRKLGTLRDKAERLAALAHDVAARVGSDADADSPRAHRAGLLAKCDLVTLMVGEFPELQGHVGSVYARLDGEDPEVAEALDWQYRHDFDAAAAPSTTALSLLLAENLDIVCEFGTKVGLPSGSTDPFGVRRAAITLLDVCERWAPGLDLRCALPQEGSDPPVFEFVDTRLRQRFRDRGAPPDHLDAIVSWRTVGEFAGRVADLAALSALPGWDRLLEVAERCRNITRKSDAPAADVRPDLLTEPAEQALFEIWRPLRDALPGAPARLSRADVERIAATLAAPLHRFFEEVFVNAEDAAVRTNRHALLREIDAALLRFADLCRIVRKPA